MADWRLRLPLFLAALVLAAATLRPWLPRGASSPPPGVSARPISAMPGRPAALPPLTHFAATIERPLFSPTRRPPAATAARLSGAAIARRYRLQGIIVVGPAKRALLIDTVGGGRLDIGKGEKIDGWTVERIEQDRLILASPAGQAALRVGEGGSAPRGPARPRRSR